MRAALVAALVSFAAPVVANDLFLDLPIDCVLGQTCHIQHYVDRDSGPGTRDFGCGDLTYDGHKGTDFAVPTLSDMRSGVNVLAAAPGIVAALRDGMPDVEFDPEQAGAVDGRECGNGVVIRHQDGWETQYCHMKSGSVAVKKGAHVDQGTVLGEVGLSGKTTFPHVHLSVRRNGAVIDPYDTGSSPICDDIPVQLWADEHSYVGGGLISAGFSDRVPGYSDVKEGTASRTDLPANAGALVLFAFAFGGREGDELQMQITGPAGQVLSNRAVLDKDQAQLFRAAGNRLKGAGWPRGIYTGTVRMFRDGVQIDAEQVNVTID